VKRVVTIDKCSILNFMHIKRFYLLKALGYYVVTTIHVQLEFENAKQKYRDSFDYYNGLVISEEISRYPLELDDLVEMSKVPQSKRASDAELSCFVVAKRIGCKVMTDDVKAVKYIQRYIQMPIGSVTNLVEILIEAYLGNHLGDHDLKLIQKKLADHKFTITIDLANEAAKRRWMLTEC